MSKATIASVTGLCNLVGRFSLTSYQAYLDKGGLTDGI